MRLVIRYNNGMAVNYSDLGFLRVRACVPEVAVGDPTANAAAILELAEQAAREHVALALFPELCVTGYSAEDLFFSDALQSETVDALARLCEESKLPLLVVGAPWRLPDGRLLNCAAAIADGRIAGMVPKSAHPNYGEFYDLRWFAGGANVAESVRHPSLGQIEIRRDQLFQLGDHLVGIEICEDLWAPESPGTLASLAGASVILNLSASNELIAKAEYRRDLVRMASAKNLSAYVYASAGPTESTKDVVYGGHCMIAENGLLLAESHRFSLEAHSVTADVDMGRVMHDRSQNITFVNAPRPRAYRIARVVSEITELKEVSRSYPKHPFVPDDVGELDARAHEILDIQATGLARRLRGARSDGLVIGLSGGLDSTLAFLVCLDALAKLGLERKNLNALTMPGPGTTKQTRGNAHALATVAGVTMREIPIGPAVAQHLSDLEHDGSHDVVYENAQARERTQILFNYANKMGGIVVGTGDLSELALGWCTYNADHMAGYNVNASVPKTLMAYLVRWYSAHRADAALAAVLEDVLDTPITPELIPPKDGEISQHTESIIGPYELHDFFLYHFLRAGAVSDEDLSSWPRGSFAGDYTAQEIQQWLDEVFFERFISQQFKRTTLPPGPKVGSVSLSPRGDWRMPDEASAGIYQKEIEQLTR